MIAIDMSRLKIHFVSKDIRTRMDVFCLLYWLPSNSFIEHGKVAAKTYLGVHTVSCRFTAPQMMYVDTRK